jgi:hypothetical protein
MWLLAGCLAPWDPAWDEPADPDRVEVTDPVVTDTTWTSDRLWVLTSVIYVEEGATLALEPGTRVLGAPGSALVVTVGSSLEAVGLPDRPIVFTSDQAEGTRQPGSWGGVVLLGEAQVAGEPPFVIEGLQDSSERGAYGGTDDTSRCGRLEYVRIEFAGYEVFPGNELNGLTLGGCGSYTYIHNVQIHKGLDDGVELFGGTVDLQNLLVTGVGDDSLDWEQGWRGRAQFILSQQYPGSGDQGLEGGGVMGSALQSSPRLYNVTLLGSGDPSVAQSGLLLREQTGAELRNLLVGWPNASGLDLGDPETAEQADAGALRVSHSSWWTAAGTPPGYGDDPEHDDDGGFDERAWLEQDPSNQLGASVGLAQPLAPQVSPWLEDPLPFWSPPASSAASDGFAVQTEDGFWDAVTFRGAVPPGTIAPWWEPWASFPED